jgi:hypothetical protein
MSKPTLFKITSPSPSAIIIAASNRHILWRIPDANDSAIYLVTDYDGNKYWQWNDWIEVKQNLRLLAPKRRDNAH